MIQDTNSQTAMMKIIGFLPKESIIIANAGLTIMEIICGITERFVASSIDMGTGDVGDNKIGMAGDVHVISIPTLKAARLTRINTAYFQRKIIVKNGYEWFSR